MIPANTLVYTPTGDVLAYKLNVGSIVFDKDHIRTPVTAITKYSVPSYLVTLDNGLMFYANNRQEFDNISIHQMIHDKTTFNTFEFNFKPCTHGFKKEIPIKFDVLAYLLSPAYSNGTHEDWFKLSELRQTDINFLKNRIEIEAPSNDYLKDNKHNFLFKSEELRTAFASMTPDPIQFLLGLPLQDRKDFLKAVYANKVHVPEGRTNNLLELVASTGQSIKDEMLTSAKPKLKSITEYHTQEMHEVRTTHDNGVMTKNYIPY